VRAGPTLFRAVAVERAGGGNGRQTAWTWYAPPVVTRPTIHNTPAETEAIFRSLPDRFRPDRAVDWGGVFHFEIDGAASAQWTVRIEDGLVQVGEGLSGEPACVVRMNEKTWIGVETGTKSPMMAFVKGRIKVTNVGQMRRYDRAFFKLYDVPK
jgi:putative sterol carrier protein